MVVAASTEAFGPDVDEWASFKLKFNKTYETFSENANRFRIFKKNLGKFREHNTRFERGDVTFRMGVNRDADMTFEEIDEREKPVAE